MTTVFPASYKSRIVAHQKYFLGPNHVNSGICNGSITAASVTAPYLQHYSIHHLYITLSWFPGLCSSVQSDHFFTALVVFILTRPFPTEIIPKYQSVIQQDPVNLSSHSCRKAKLCPYGRVRHWARSAQLIYTRPSKTQQQQNKTKQTTGPPQPEDAVDITNSEWSQSFMSYNKVREGSEKALHIRNPILPILQSSFSREKAFLPLSTPKRCASSMLGQSKRKLRPIWRLCLGLLLHMSLKLKHFQPKWKL